MATGSLDANGIWIYGEDDSETTFSGLLNKLGDSVSDKFTGGLAIASGGTGSNTLSAAQESLRIGLIPISPTSVAKAGAGSTASANTLGFITFTACTSLTLEGVFSPTYRNYLVKIECATSASTEFRFRVRADGTDAATNYYQGGWVIYSGGTSASQSLQNQGYAYVSKGLNNTDPQVAGTIQFTNVNRAVRTTWQAQFSGATDTVGDGHWLTGGAHTTTYGMTGLTVYPSTGTIGGSIQVFGYND